MEKVMDCGRLKESAWKRGVKWSEKLREEFLAQIRKGAVEISSSGFFGSRYLVFIRNAPYIVVYQEGVFLAFLPKRFLKRSDVREEIRRKCRANFCEMRNPYRLKVWRLVRSWGLKVF